MSNFLAISTVTESLRQMLEAELSKDLSGGARCTAVRPMGNGSSDGLPELGANLYLYQASPNPSWRNADLPTRREDGTIIQRPRMALDLYYLLTFYGDEKRLEPQRAMGSVLRTLHSRPVLTRDQIRSAVNAVDFISGSDLAEEPEQVKFTPIPLSVEELYNMWSGLFQTPYNLSMAYQASVVFVEGDESPQKALPVRARNLYVSPFRQPVIERIMSMESKGMAAFADQPILVGHILVILGSHLKGDLTLVRIGGVVVEPETVEENRIEITLASPPLPPHLLRAGPQGIQVVHQMLMGTPPVPHRGIESNVLAFVLRPAIVSMEVSDLKMVGPLVYGVMSLKVNPAVRKGQRTAVLLNEISSTPEAYTFYLNACIEDSNFITLSVDGVRPGRYLVRIQVDGAESLLHVDSDQKSPTYNQYIGPVVIVEVSNN
jgi:hypothetical protein